MTQRAPEAWERLVDQLAKLRPGRENGVEADALSLAQELHIHQVELEMQNRELRDTQERLEASHARYAELYDGAPVGYATLDRHGLILEINLTASAMLGRERERLIGVPFAAAADIQPTAFLSHLRVAGRKASSATMDVEIGTRAGPRSFQLTTAPYFDGDRHLLGFRTTMNDMSERALLEKERLARKEADEANRMKDQFLGIVSHELRTPLNAMIGWMQILGSRANDPALVQRGLAVMQRNGQALARIVEDILDVSRIVSGKMRMDMQKVDMTSVVRGAVAQAQVAATAKQIVLRESVAPGVGIRGDATRLQQVAANLLSNAVKFTGRGGHVEVVLERVDGSIRLSVRDDGCGIRADDLGHIFEHFSQADSSTTRAHAGLGLGLAIARHIVEAHGGTIRADSAGQGLGTAAVVDLPDRIYTRPPPPRVGAGQEGRPSLAGVRVLFVDDDTDALELYHLVLDGMGVVIRTATAADEAFDLLSSFLPDVLVSDIAMPVLDGFALIERIRAAPPPFSDLPAIALTAYARADDADRVLRAGFTKHLAKPVDPTLLADAIAELVWAKAPELQRLT
ncbi:MAG: ATP-binding protein [Myxococcota bacterium]|nr:ATP-binding protein [Myxococcota bacterium]